MDLNEAARLGRRLLDEHGLPDWILVFDRAKRRAGVCRPARKKIGLSGPLTAIHPEDEVRDTILHEIAHALVGPQHGHDQVWRATALRIGCSGQRCSSADAPRVEGDWVGTCPAGHRKTRHRRPERVSACGTCSAATSSIEALWSSPVTSPRRWRVMNPVPHATSSVRAGGRSAIQRSRSIRSWCQSAGRLSA